MTFETTIQHFLLGLSSLFSIVNPVGGSLVFAQVTAPFSHRERVVLSRRIGLYAALVMVTALWAGAPILNFFGVSLGALRIAGGLVVAASAWVLLNRPESREVRKQAEANTPRAGNDRAADPLAEIAFFPLTLPFTTGPGTIAVAIALGSNRPAEVADRLGYYVGMTLAGLGVAAAVALLYAEADRVVNLIGPVRARIVGRLFAFLLLCVGTQIMINGLTDVLGPLLRPAR